jgi:hypothetical protein
MEMTRLPIPNTAGGYLTIYSDGTKLLLSINKKVTSGEETDIPVETGKVAVTSGDTLGFLSDKLLSGDDIAIESVVQDGKTYLRIGYTGEAATDSGLVALSVSDTSPGYLASKVTAGTGINLSVDSETNQLIISTSETSVAKLSLEVYDPAGIEEQLVGLNATQTLTNKTFKSCSFQDPSGITKTHVGLNNVDNTSDATKVTEGPISIALSGKEAKIPDAAESGMVLISGSGSTKSWKHLWTELSFVPTDYAGSLLSLPGNVTILSVRDSSGFCDQIAASGAVYNGGNTELDFSEYPPTETFTIRYS